MLLYLEDAVDTGVQRAGVSLGVLSVLQGIRP